MAYFKIGENDYSNIVKNLTIKKEYIYNSQTNAAGTSVVDVIGSKRVVEITTIPLTAAQIAPLLADIDEFGISISYRDPRTNALATMNCIVPNTDIDYYTIQVNRVMYNELTLTFTEL